MPDQNKNLRRALAILSTEPDETDIAIHTGCVCVAGQNLRLHDVDDSEVLSILMADKEHGFAVTRIDETIRTLRAMQQVWCDAADELKREVAA